MKINKYIIIAISVLSMTSCVDDDFSRKYVDNEVKTELVGTIELSRSVAAPTTLITFNFTLPQSVSEESTIEVTATNSFNNITRAYVTIPAGQTSGSGLVEMAGRDSDVSDFFGIDNYTTVKLTGLAITQPATGGIDDPFVLTSNEVTVRAIDYHGIYMSSPNLVPGSMQILMDWANPGDNDLDMYVFNSDTFAQVEGAASGSRYEGDFFNDFHADGNYFVAVDFWIAAGGDLPYSFHFTHPDGSVDYYEGVFQDTENLGFEFPILLITKTTDGAGVSSYTTSLP